jgi:hypothetical protein
MKTKLFQSILFVVLAMAMVTTNAQNSKQEVLTAANLTVGLMGDLCKNGGLEVLSQEESYIKINVKISDSLGVAVYLDLNTDKDYIIISKQMAFIDGCSATTAKELISKINTQTNFIKAGYDSEAQIDFRYYFWTKDGYTAEGLISAIEEFKLCYMYAVSLDTDNILK